MHEEETVSPLFCGSPFSLDIDDLGAIRMLPGAKRIHTNKQAETPTGARVKRSRDNLRVALGGKDWEDAFDGHKCLKDNFEGVLCYCQAKEVKREVQIFL